MGCTSSTQYGVDPVTGKETKKKRLGGAYPGQRRPQHQPHMPAPSQFGPDGTATVHFMAYGGGNALTLVQQDGTAQPAIGKPQPQYIQVTLPEGVTEGQTIHVQAPDGKVNAIVVPPGYGAGSTFTVEFSDGPPPAAASSTAAPGKTSEPAPQQQQQQSTTAAQPLPPNNHVTDDGFASGFNNPHWTPSPAVTATAVASSEPAVQAEPDIALGDSYPTTLAQPVYSTAPVYPSK